MDIAIWIKLNTIDITIVCRFYSVLYAVYIAHYFAIQLQVVKVLKSVAIKLYA